MDLKKYKLGDVGKIITGKTPPTNNSNNYGGEIPFLTPSDDLSTVYVESTAKMLSNLGVRSVKKCLLPPRSVCVSCIGSDLGRVILTKVETVTNQQFNAIIPHSEFNSEYLYYYLTSLEKYFKELSASSTSVPIINKSQFSQIEISLPKLSEQEVIAQCLSVIDRKIALNREINRNLEAMARQLYDYWFVQFDFPDENGKPYKSSGGKMVWNEKIKREIPEGWKIVSLPTIATFTNGLACQKFRPKSEDEKLPVIKIREMRDGITSESEWVAADIPDAVKVYDGDILFSWSASLEVMIWTGGEGGLNQHIFKVEPKSYYPKAFVYIQILDYISVFKGIAEARKTTMGHITQDHLNQSQIVIPASKSILQAFENTISPIVNLFVKLSQQSKQLMRQRDKLLPLLMNGQVSVMPREINCDLSHG